MEGEACRLERGEGVQNRFVVRGEIHFFSDS